MVNMTIIKLRFHSMVHEITNSSTVIYTYSGGCIEPVKEMINEFAKIDGANKTADDMFYFGVFCDIDTYLEHEYCDDGEPPVITTDTTEKHIEEFMEKVMKGEIEKPAWMTEVEESEGWSYYSPDTNLHILPKSEEYEKLGKKITRFLYSTNHEGARDG